MLAVYIQYKSLFKNVPNPALPKGFTETFQLTCRHMFFLIVGIIYPIQIYVYFVMFIFEFIFEEYMPVVFIYWCWKYHTNNWGNVSVGGFLSARECTFCNVYICIGCMLPTFGEYTSVEGFLCALRAQS